MNMTPEQIELLYSVKSLIDSFDKNKILTEEVKQNMTKSLAEFTEEATRKFIKGQQEHGGDLRDRQLELELFNEQIDFFWYSSARVWPKKPFVKEDYDRNE